MFRSHHRNCDLSNSWNFLVLLSSFNGTILQETYIQWCLTVCVESLKLQMRKATAFAGTNFKHGNYLIFWQSQNTEREMVKKKQILCPNSLKWNMDFCKKKKKKKYSHMKNTKIMRHFPLEKEKECAEWYTENLWIKEEHTEWTQYFWN